MMRLVFGISALLLLGSVSQGESFRVFAPSRSSESLLIVEGSDVNGELTLRQAASVSLGFPAATITSHPKTTNLYVAEPRGEEGKARGAVVMLDRHRSYQKYQPITLRHGCSYLSVDRTGKFLMGVHYREGHVDIYRLGKSGMPDQQTTALSEGRKNAHCILPTRDNRFVYIPYVKETNAIFQYRFDAGKGTLSPLEPMNAEPPQGTGPRHIAYHPTKPIIYFSNEQHLGVSAYEIGEEGQLRRRQIASAVGSDRPAQGVSSSDIAITENGRYIFAGIRGHAHDFDWIARYKVMDSGELEPLGLTKADKIPWGLTLSPNGNYLLVSAFQGATLTAYRITAEGDLKRATTLAWQPQISDLVALPVGPIESDK